MKLYLLRHGEAADHGDPRYENDADRPLTARGIHRTKQLAHLLRRLDIGFDAILSSPLVRARQTAEVVARGLRLRRPVELTDHLAPTGDFSKLIALANQLRPRPDGLLLVGHEPYLSALISRLCSGGQGLALNLKKGGFCRLNVETLGTGRCADLEWLLAPRLLDSKRPKKR